MLLAPGDEGPPGDAELAPHPVKSVAAVAADAAWHTPAQNRRREMEVSGSDIAEPCAQDRGRAKTGPFYGVRGICDSR